MNVIALVESGPLLLALPVAAAAGAVTFLSPCCLPLVPGYLAYITGMTGADSGGRQATVKDTEAPGKASSTVAVGDGAGVVAVAAAPAVTAANAPRGRMVTGTALFVLGFSVVFSLLGLTVGGISQLLHAYSSVITQVLGGITVLLGLLFLGAFDRFMFAGRVIRPTAMPRAGLAGAPLLGALFGIGWTPCIGPTLVAVQTMSFSTGTAARGAFIALVYGLGLGIPFLVVAALFQRATSILAYFRRNARLVTRIGGIMLVVLGLVEVTGTWTLVIAWLHTHWYHAYTPQL